MAKMERYIKLTVSTAVTGLAIYAGVGAVRQLYMLWRKSGKCPVRTRTNVEIHVISSPEQWNEHVTKFEDQLKILKVIGLDCEWVYDRSNGHRSPVALLQMATPYGLCLLVRLCHMGDKLPQSLCDILSDPRILKVGVAVRDDGRKLLKDYGIFVQGCVDLRHMLARVKLYTCDGSSLKGVAEGVLRVRMDKRKEVRCSNWETRELRPDQVSYAAADAQVGVDVFTKLVLTKLTGMDPGDRVWTLEGVDLEQMWRVARALCQGIMDVGFKTGSANRNPQTSHSKKSERDGERGRAYCTRSRPLYHNCQLQAPDGQPLCTCDIRKAEWYIEKELGDKISDEPLTVRLRFEPSGRPESTQNYYLQEKENVCVVCSRADVYTRKFVVPQEYRKYFPPALKDHRSHDILLLCPPCHQVSSDHDNVLRQRLAEECSAPIDTGVGLRSEQDQQRMKVRSAAKALKLSRAKIPEERVKELEQIVTDFLGVTSLTDDILDSCINLDTRIYNQQYLPHGKKVVEHTTQNGCLFEFERRWRHHFKETMKPRYLPPLWSIDHHHHIGVLSTP